MKLTLLGMTQAILSSLNSDEVNSISDTPESLQVAEILKQTYFNILSRSKLPMQEELFQLTDSGDPFRPVLMFRPDNVSKMYWLKYFDDAGPSESKQYKYVTILPVTQFIDMINTFSRDDPDTDILIFSANGKNFEFHYKNNKQPQFCTVLENFYIIFDGYDSSVETTLHASKSMCGGEVLPVWSNTDSFIPDLDDQQFPLLLNEAKSLAFFELKQSAHPKAEQEAKRQWGILQKDKSLTDKPSYFDQLPDFGRKAYRNTSYFKARGWDAN